uniref:Uncharacterized protein n=1 Tax=Romanomermis culicivorax TaxID=13658 RepID=A0A915IBA1_ROMCU
MAARYEMVDEPEAMEVVDDGVYHPDLTISSSSHHSFDTFKSLEPIVAGPISLKVIFYGSDWSNMKRRIYVSLAAILVLSSVAVFITLFTGLITTLSRIRQLDKMKESGLFIVPASIGENGIFLYNLPGSSSDARSLVDNYIAEIDKFLTDYRKQTTCIKDSGGTCKSNAIHKHFVDSNCTQDNKYGFYDGSPCILFGMRNPRESLLQTGKWSPEITEDFLKGLTVFASVAKHRLANLNVNATPITCYARHVIFNTLREIEVASNLFLYYPDSGFENSLLIGNEVSPLTTITIS